MFLVVTISTALYLDVPFIVHIFDSHSGGFNSVSGFLDYSDLLKLGTTSTLLFLFNQGLADGLLVGAVSKPIAKCLMLSDASALSLLHHLCHEFLGHCLSLPDVLHIFGYVPKCHHKPTELRLTNITNTATGVIFIILLLQDLPPGTVDFGIAYFSVALLLNVLLTVMVVIRLILHSRNIHSAIGAPAGASGVYKTAITMLIESCALYAICCLPVIGLWMTINTTLSISFPILSGAQVCTPMFPGCAMILGHGFLIIVMDRSLPRSSSPYESQKGGH